MSIVPQNPTQGTDLLSGAQDFLTHDDVADNKDGLGYVHRPEENSATEAESWCDFFRAVRDKIAVLSRATIQPVRNETGGLLPAGTVGFMDGYVPAELSFLIGLSDANSLLTPAQFVLAEDLADNANGDGYAFVEVGALDTSAAAAVGDNVYVSPTPGEYVFAAPGALEDRVIGIVTVKDASVGQIAFFVGSSYVAYALPLAPAAHAATHLTAGSDAIQLATNAQEGLASAAQILALETVAGLVDQSVVSGSSPTFLGTNITGLISGSVDQVHLIVRKGTAGTIVINRPVYITGYNPAGWIEVEEADNTNAAKMPAIGLTEGAITNAANGEIATSGRLTGQDTSAWGVGASLWVGAAAAMVSTKPTGTALIQKIAQVARSHASAGVLTVFGAGRVNDVPNIPNLSIWQGNASGVATPIALKTAMATANSNSVTSGENLAAGDFINLYNDAGTLKARKADASTTAYAADGFVLAVSTTGNPAIVYPLGGPVTNTQLAGLTVASRYYLSDSTPGGVTTTAPTDAGELVQFLGKAIATTTILPVYVDPVLIGP